MARPAKRGRGRGRPLKYDPNNLPEFFNVFLPEYNSKQLLIPPNFVRDFLGKTLTKLTLKNIEGKVWNVELEKRESKLFMKKGWESFVMDNSLEPGEFLVFAYYGYGEFTVRIFSISGCKRNGTSATSELALVKVKQEPNMDENLSPCTPDDEKTCITREAKVELESKVSLEVKTKVVPDRAIESKKIQFTKVYTGQPYEMHFPSAVLTQYNIERPKVESPQTILLWNQNRESHKVRLLNRGDRVALTCGWNEFQKDNKLVKGDECQFEVILGKQRRIKEILLLRIIRRKTGRSRKTRLGPRLRNR